jgi:hypothetical protein
VHVIINNMGYIHKTKSGGWTLNKDFGDCLFERFWVYTRNIPFVSCKKSLKNPFD